MPDSPIDLAAQPPALRIDDAAREHTVRRLSDAFARGMIRVDELEARMEAVYGATHQDALDALVADLGAADSLGDAIPVEVHAPQQVTALFSSVENSRIVTVSRTVRITARFGTVENTVLDVMPPRLELSVFAGTIEIDLRHTHFPAGMTEIHVSALMGGIEIYLPATVTLDNAGSAIMGSFEIHDESSRMGSRAALAARGRSYVRLTGRAVMGNLQIHHVPV